MKHNPEEFARMQRSLYGPDWRRRCAEAAAAAAPGPAADLSDPQAQDLCAYLGLCREGPGGSGRAAHTFPHIAAAVALAADPACRQAKVLVLGGCPPGEVAERLGLEPAALAAWEALYFDVRPARAATFWVMTQVIQPEQRRGDGHLAALLTFACAGGPVAAQAALDAEARVSLRQGQTLLDQKIRLHLKFTEAIDAPLATDRDKSRFIKTYADLRCREQRLRLEERRLAQRSAEALRKERAAQARLERRRQREQDRAARQAEKARPREERRARARRRRRDARASARQARRQVARQRAAASALAGLRWEFAEPARAGAAAGPLGATPPSVPEGRRSCPEGPRPPGGQAPAAGEEGVERPTADNAPAAPARRRGVA